jgi:retron-type reverse transcriptase
MQRELEELIKKYSFAENARWAYLENDGSYHFYDKETNYTIESRYREVYYQLSQDNYQHYSVNIDISSGGASYMIEFAQLGRVHR